MGESGQSPSVFAATMLSDCKVWRVAANGFCVDAVSRCPIRLGPNLAFGVNLACWCRRLDSTGLNELLGPKAIDLRFLPDGLASSWARPSRLASQCGWGPTSSGACGTPPVSSTCQALWPAGASSAASKSPSSSSEPDPGSQTSPIARTLARAIAASGRSETGVAAPVSPGPASVTRMSLPALLCAALMLGAGGVVWHTIKTPLSRVPSIARRIEPRPAGRATRA
jgi:hypothetical protein